MRHRDAIDGLHAFTLPEGDKSAGALRSYLLASCYHGGLRRLRVRILWILSGGGLLVWACAGWPELLDDGIRRVVLGAWLLGILSLVLVCGVERWWQRKVEECLSRLGPPPEGRAKEIADG